MLLIQALNLWYTCLIKSTARKAAEKAKDKGTFETMNNKETYIPAAINPADIDKIIACADGVCALLYLHVLRCGAFSLSCASRDLKCSESQIALAADTLRRLGLLQEGSLPSADELPEYGAEEITAKSKTDGNFEFLVFEAERALGKMLSTNDLKILLGIYDHLGLPAEVIVLLINHCVETHRQMHGEGRLPTMRGIEKEAWHWIRTEVLTLDMAEAHIMRQAQKSDETEQAKAALQIRGRALTVSEKKYIEAWLDLGFSPDALAVAYDRTVTSTGKLVWKYMDKIISSWQEKNLHTVQEIELGDTKPQRSAAAPREGSDDDAQNMRKMYERMQKDR